MTNVLRAVAGVLMVGLMSPWPVYADSVTITSGVLTWHSSGLVEGSLSGMDASLRSFSFQGVGMSAIGPVFCHSCEGGPVVFVGLDVGGSDVSGIVAYGGQAGPGNPGYRVGSMDTETHGSLGILLGGNRSFDMLNLQPGTFVTFIVDFHLRASFFRPPDLPVGYWLPGGGLAGSGLAYVNFQVETPMGGNAVSTEYRFGESALTPEPATALLFATGALVLATRRRRGRPSE